MRSDRAPGRHLTESPRPATCASRAGRRAATVLMTVLTRCQADRKDQLATLVQVWGPCLATTLQLAFIYVWFAIHSRSPRPLPRGRTDPWSQGHGGGLLAPLDRGGHQRGRQRAADHARPARTRRLPGRAPAFPASRGAAGPPHRPAVLPASFRAGAGA